VDAAALATGLKTDVLSRRVSFETGEIGSNKVRMSCSGTVTEIYFVVDKLIEATDNGTITAADNAGTGMTAGVITATAGSVLGTAFSVLPSANNTFVVDDVLTFTTAKVTAGGFGTIFIRYVRT
jgi:hypothetical protein